jgi:hypothetical protein
MWLTIPGTSTANMKAKHHILSQFYPPLTLTTYTDVPLSIIKFFGFPRKILYAFLVYIISVK